ncbi:histidine kinase [Psychrobacillus psychrodurans]|uniref:Histidine kinase n=1 Tax=Psychrobacillus psychrodurans TaxID=126157 RepID=A0A9X3R9L6_9BACI|nr:histidine kinase [Psychrobacillus psychrodurans]MCZ8533131.1 histidine kinase [Psychrobacillus psychrodurans]
MRKIIIFNIIFCLLVIFVCNTYYDSKSRSAVAYNYAASYVETNYEISRENIQALEVNYRIGMGLFEILLEDVSTKEIFSFEVDIRKDYSLYYFKDHTYVYRKNDGVQ